MTQYDVTCALPVYRNDSVTHGVPEWSYTGGQGSIGTWGRHGTTGSGMYTEQNL